MEKAFFKGIENGGNVEGPSFIVEKRHWGTAVTLDANTRVNSISDEPSLHFHTHRTEDYILYSGEMEVYRGAWHEGDLEKTVGGLVATKLQPGDRVVITPGTVHIPINLSSEGSVFIEISHGPYAEKDVVRVYDKTGRDAELAKKWQDLGYEQGVGVRELIAIIKSNGK